MQDDRPLPPDPNLKEIEWLLNEYSKLPPDLIPRAQKIIAENTNLHNKNILLPLIQLCDILTKLHKKTAELNKALDNENITLNEEIIKASQINLELYNALTFERDYNKNLLTDQLNFELNAALTLEQDYNKNLSYEYHLKANQLKYAEEKIDEQAKRIEDLEMQLSNLEKNKASIINPASIKPPNRYALMPDRDITENQKVADAATTLENIKNNFKPGEQPYKISRSKTRYSKSPGQ